MTIGQIYKHNRQKFNGDILAYEVADAEAGSHLFVLAETVEPENKTRQFFKALAEGFCAPLPATRQAVTESYRLARVNTELKNIFKNVSPKASCALVSVSAEKISAAAVGRMFVGVLRNKKLIEISSAEKFKSGSFFNNFITGEIKPQDIVVVTSRSLFNCVSAEQLTELLCQNEVNRACAEILELVKKVGRETEPVFGFIIKPQTQTYLTAQQPAAPVKKRRWFKLPAIHLPSRRFIKKTLLVTAALGLMIFGAAFVKSNISSQTAAKQTKTELQQLEQAEAKLNEAEAALIYKDINRAQSLLLEAEDILAQTYALGDDDLQKQKQWQALQKRFQQIQTELKQ